MKTSGAQLLSVLTENGYKKTPTRVLFARWLADSPGVFSVTEALQALTVDRVSLYRTIDVFETLDLIHSVSTIHGEKHYERHDRGDAHHHHVVCDGCERVACVDCRIDQPKIDDFAIVHHQLLFSGTCKTCA